MNNSPICMFQHCPQRDECKTANKDLEQNQQFTKFEPDVDGYCEQFVRIDHDK